MGGLLLGVDGGNTKTIAVVARRDGTVVGVGKSGLSDIHGAPTPSDGAAEIVRAVDSALAAADATVSDLDAALFSLAGADWPEDFVYLRGELGRRLGLAGEPVIVNDAVGAIRSGSPDWTGIAVVCGTGGAVGARNEQGDVFHYGFWPDGTGGGALGAQGLAAVWRADLGVGPETSLTRRALEHWGRASPVDLLHAFTRLDIPPIPNSEKSHFAEVVLEEAAAGDPVAVEIVTTAGARLGEYGRLSADRVALADGYTVVLCGGVLRHPSPLLRESILARLPAGRPVAGITEPVVGAVLLAGDSVGATPDGDVIASGVLSSGRS